MAKAIRLADALSLGTLLTALEQVLDATPWSSTPLVIAGNSLGAWVAMLYAEKYPHRVTRVILIDGGPIKSVVGDWPDAEESRRGSAYARCRAGPFRAASAEFCSG